MRSVKFRDIVMIESLAAVTAEIEFGTEFMSPYPNICNTNKKCWPSEDCFIVGVFHSIFQTGGLVCFKFYHSVTRYIDKV